MFAVSREEHSVGYGCEHGKMQSGPRNPQVLMSDSNLVSAASEFCKQSPILEEAKDSQGRSPQSHHHRGQMAQPWPGAVSPLHPLPPAWHLPGPWGHSVRIHRLNRQPSIMKTRRGQPPKIQSQNSPCCRGVLW